MIASSCRGLDSVVTMTEGNETRPAQSEEVRKGGPVRVPDGKGFFGPTHPTGGEKPPREKIATTPPSTDSAQQSRG